MSTPPVHSWARATCAHCHDTILLRPVQPWEAVRKATWIHPDGYIPCWHGKALAVPVQEPAHTQLSLFEATA